MKRLFDLFAGLLLLFLLAIPMILIAILIRSTSKGPSLYWSDRVGKNNMIFRMPKFRSMLINTPEVASHSLENPDYYLSPIGSFLRRTSLDELPQLFSVIRGDMSFVGPRPALFNQKDLIALRTDGAPLATGIPPSVIWFIALTALATWILMKTRYGNWIFASGGDKNGATNVGVPVGKVKIGLFIGTAVAATLFATIQVLDAGSADTMRGSLKELEAIAAAVVGGCLLTGGYGSAIGAAFGALIFGTVSMGIFYTDVDTDWFKVFLGAMMLIAVLFNNFIRKKVTESK